MPPRSRKTVVAEQEEERSFGWSFLTKYVEVKHISAILVVVAALLFYFRFESDVDGAFNSLQEKQMWADSVRSTPAFVERPDVEAMLRTLVTRHDARYALVLGEKASGKSTMLKKVASETSGCYYLPLNEFTDSNSLVQALAQALRIRPRSAFLVLLQRFLGIADADSSLTIKYVFSVIENAAIIARKHGEKFALIIDDINLMERDEESSKALAMLQQRAKKWADEDWLNVVFVASDFTAFDRMSAISASSRMELEYIGDLSREQALSYMKRRAEAASLNLSTNELERALDAVGYRFGELKELYEKIEKNMTVDDAVAAIYNLRDVELNRLMPLLPRFKADSEKEVAMVERSVSMYRALRDLVVAGSLSRKALNAAAGNNIDVIGTLLSHNILAFHLKGGKELVIRPHSIAMKAVIVIALEREQGAFEEVEKRLSTLK